LDSLIFNTDRHTANYGFIFDTNTLELVSLAPIYDNDNSLFNRVGLLSKHSSSVLEEIKGYQPRTYSCHTFVEQARRCMTRELFEKVKLVSTSFTFKNHDKYPLNDERMKRMSALVRWQAKNIIDSYNS